MEQVVERLAQFLALGTPQHEPVNIAALLDDLLESERARIEKRGILVLKEIDSPTMALADAQQLHFALGLLLEEAVASLPERADLYLASRRVSHDPNEAGASRVGVERTAPRVQILLRYRAPGGAGVGFGDDALHVAIAEELVRAQGGAFAVDAGTAGEANVRVELPAA